MTAFITEKMGFLTDLFFPKTPATPPSLTSILPHQAVLKIEAGVLPCISADKILLSKGENCHYVEVAAIVTEKKHIESKRDGASFRVFKGCYYHTGESKSEPVYETEYTKGILFFTNKRVVFHASKQNPDTLSFFRFRRKTNQKQKNLTMSQKLWKQISKKYF